jgi:hypothetical protein
MLLLLLPLLLLLLLPLLLLLLLPLLTAVVARISVVVFVLLCKKTKAIANVKV